VARQLPKELDFIQKYRISNHDLEYAKWRISDFDADKWECSFGYKTFYIIDFRKVINDGSLLTNLKNRALLNNIKRFICLQTHPLLTGSISVSKTTSLQRVSIALQIIDYFLLQGSYLKISSNGFSNITKDDIVMFIDTITKNQSIKISIYQPKKWIVSFLKNIKLSTKKLAWTQATYPDLFEFGGLDSDCLLTKDQLINARAWLKLHNYYHQAIQSEGSEFKYRVQRNNLLTLIIGNRVLCNLKFKRLQLEGLDVAPSHCYVQELPAVPVSNIDEDERASTEFVGIYISALKSMRIASQNGSELISDHALTAIENTELLRYERTKERTRFTTIPFDIVNMIFGKSIEFYIEYGANLIDYYIALAATGDNIRDLPIPIPNKLKKLGISAWRLPVDTPTDFFQQLRSGSSLYNMLEVLYGAIGILVNTLMARRASELDELTQECIVKDSDRYFLAFNLRKANVLEHRQRSLRPLPHIAAEALQLLARLSNTLQKLGYTTNKYLFGFPFSAYFLNSSLYGTAQPELRRCFNRFCDYFQIPTDDQGRRYYVRQHQLRRNFALLFFWKGSFGGVEVLRHFLGHTKPSMTYNYVTESIPGKILKRIKATVAKDMIKVNHEATEGFAKLICDRYGITLNQLHILPEQDVVNYIEDLIASGDAVVEPEFIEGPNGEEYRIIYRIIDKSMPKIEA
jgi:integrase